MRMSGRIRSVIIMRRMSCENGLNEGDGEDEADSERGENKDDGDERADERGTEEVGDETVKENAEARAEGTNWKKTAIEGSKDVTKRSTKRRERIAHLYGISDGECNDEFGKLSYVKFSKDIW
uniref:Uncharacterized protein n=1 Tax=Fopius arisanus TaxID=64838 RepID=A0A0C9S0E0_9HYME